MGAVGFFLIVGVLFSIALYAAGYYVWSVPEQEAAERLSRACASKYFSIFAF